MVLLAVNMKHNLLQHFLKIPTLDFSSKNFKYPNFYFTEDFAGIPKIDFPSELLLGKQAEFLFETLLHFSDHYTIIASNIQIQGATETLGELDYLVENSLTKQVIHIELACKFYLLDLSLGNTIEEQWIGPNRKDRLIDKLAKLTTRQFPILFASETKTILDTFQLNSKQISQQLCLKASLFLPLEMSLEVIPESYKKCVIGRYMRIDDFNKLSSKALYALPKKKEWLVPITSITEWSSYTEAKEIITHLLLEKRTLLVYQKTGEIIKKFFVVWW